MPSNTAARGIFGWFAHTSRRKRLVERFRPFSCNPRTHPSSLTGSLPSSSVPPATSEHCSATAELSCHTPQVSVQRCQIVTSPPKLVASRGCSVAGFRRYNQLQPLSSWGVPTEAPVRHEFRSIVTTTVGNNGTNSCNTASETSKVTLVSSSGATATPATAGIPGPSLERSPLICVLRRTVRDNGANNLVGMRAPVGRDRPLDRSKLLVGTVSRVSRGGGQCELHNSSACQQPHSPDAPPARKILIKLEVRPSAPSVCDTEEAKRQRRDEHQPSDMTPSFSTSNASSLAWEDGDTLVYNIFTQRVVKSSSASIRTLSVLGVGVRAGEKELSVVDIQALVMFRDKLRAEEIGWPAAWRSSLFRQLHHVLLQDRSPSEVVSRVCELLQLHYRRAKRSHVTGISRGECDAATEGSAAASDEVGTSGEMAYHERLFAYPDLNEEQKRVVDFVLRGYNTYIGGGAGTGKSLLLRVIKQELVSRGLAVATTATTGIAARRLNGTTLHHCFGVNVYGEFTRRAELREFDVIIVDEVSMLSKELFESLEYQLRRANGVDLPFGGVQVILSGDFLQLGAICSVSLVHSSVFRRNFAMLKLQQPVRQEVNSVFAQQLQELRRGVVPHDLQDTVQFLTPPETAKWSDGEGKNAVKLLPTNKEVDEVNRTELDKLTTDLVQYPPQIQAPSLVGRWTATYILEVVLRDSKFVDVQKLTRALEQYMLEFFQNTPYAGDFTLPIVGQRYIVLYQLFVDAFAFRVRIPQEMSEKDMQNLSLYLRKLETWLPSCGLGVCLREILDSPDGLHTDADDYTLMRYAELHPMAAPLRLKKGAKVMLRTNLAPGLVNGSLGMVVGFKELNVNHLPRFISTPGRTAVVENYAECLRYEHGFTTAIAPEVDFGGGHVVVIPPVLFSVGGLSNTNHYHVGIVALPLSLAYAFTVHKVQGLTLSGRVHLELSRMWPCDHLLYVAMSRVRSPEQLAVTSFHNSLVRCASECLLFDDSLPPVDRVRVLPHFFQASWQRTPSRRKAALQRKKEQAKQSKLKKAAKVKETRTKGAAEQVTP